MTRARASIRGKRAAAASWLCAAAARNPLASRSVRVIATVIAAVYPALQQSESNRPEPRKITFEVNSRGGWYEARAGMAKLTTHRARQPITQESCKPESGHADGDRSQPKPPPVVTDRPGQSSPAYFVDHCGGNIASGQPEPVRGPFAGLGDEQARCLPGGVGLLDRCRGHPIRRGANGCLHRGDGFVEQAPVEQRRGRGSGRPRRP